MRDPARIPVVLEALSQYWEKHPYLRLAQILSEIAAALRIPTIFLEEGDILNGLTTLTPAKERIP